MDNLNQCGTLEVLQLRRFDMDTSRDIPLTVEEYEELARAMQFPEDLEAWDRANTPTLVTLDGDILTVVDRLITHTN